MSKRRTHSPEFKAKVASEAISGRNTLQEIATDGAECLNRVSRLQSQAKEATLERPRGIRTYPPT